EWRIKTAVHEPAKTDVRAGPETAAAILPQGPDEVVRKSVASIEQPLGAVASAHHQSIATGQPKIAVVVFEHGGHESDPHLLRSQDDHKIVAYFFEKSTFTGYPKLAVPIFEDDPSSVERSQLFLRNRCKLSVLETTQS